MGHFLISRMKDGDGTIVPYDDGHEEDEGDETSDDIDSENDSDTSEEVPVVSPGSTRCIAHGVLRKDDSDDDQWPTKETQLKALKKFWGKFKVNQKGGHGGVPSSHDAEPEAPPEFEPEASSDSDSDSSSAPVAMGSRGPVQDFPMPLCVEYEFADECQGDQCLLCARVGHEISIGELEGKDTEKFQDAIMTKSQAEHMRAMKATDAVDPTTMRSPACERPGFFGFALVPTPPKADKSDVPRFNLYKVELFHLHGLMFLVLGFCSYPLRFRDPHRPCKVPENTPEVAEPKKTKNAKKTKDGEEKSTRGKKRTMKQSKKSVKKRSVNPTVPNPISNDGECDHPIEPIEIYKGYDISMLPMEARPVDLSKCRGEHSYTLRSKTGEATIEVLLKHSAYYCKKIAPHGQGTRGQVSMKYYGPVGAWKIAKSRAGFECLSD